MSSLVKQEKQKLVVVLVSRLALSRKNRSWSIYNEANDIYFTGHLQQHSNSMKGFSEQEGEMNPGKQEGQVSTADSASTQADRAPDTGNPHESAGNCAPG